MRTALSGLVLVLAGCTASTSTDVPLVHDTSPAPTPVTTFGCTGCSPAARPAPVPLNRCVPPGCQITTPRAASRSRSTGVKKHVDRSGGTQDVTAYCTGDTTWSGRAPGDGQVAVLDRSIPMYAKAHVYGAIKGDAARAAFGSYYDRTFVVTDHIGHGSDIDIYMTSCSRGRAWGRQHLHVTFTTH